MVCLVLEVCPMKVMVIRVCVMGSVVSFLDIRSGGAPAVFSVVCPATGLIVVPSDNIFLLSKGCFMELPGRRMLSGADKPVAVGVGVREKPNVAIKAALCLGNCYRL